MGGVDALVAEAFSDGEHLRETADNIALERQFEGDVEEHLLPAECMHRGGERTRIGAAVHHFKRGSVNLEEAGLLHVAAYFADDARTGLEAAHRIGIGDPIEITLLAAYFDTAEGVARGTVVNFAEGHIRHRLADDFQAAHEDGRLTRAGTEEFAADTHPVTYIQIWYESDRSIRRFTRADVGLETFAAVDDVHEPGFAHFPYREHPCSHDHSGFLRFEGIECSGDVHNGVGRRKSIRVGIHAAVEQMFALGEAVFLEKVGSVGHG